MLSLENVQVNIGRVNILRNVTLDVGEAEIVGLVGRNGAGKTTTMRSIMGHILISEGSIHFDGHDLTRMPGHQRARLGIGYAPEDRRLIPSLMVEENLLMPAWANNLQNAQTRLEKIYHHMPEVKEFSSRRANQLSGGQQKLVAMARALMTGRKLLLLDEPFEGLAPALSERMRDALRAFQEEGLAALIAQSEYSHVRSLTQNIYTIERGSIHKDAVVT